MHVHLISIKISIVGTTHTFIKSQGLPGHHFGSMSHDRKTMERWLTVKQEDIVIEYVSLHSIANLKIPCSALSVAKS